MRIIPIHERHSGSAEPSTSANANSSPAAPAPATAGSASANGANQSGPGAVHRPRGIARVPTHTVGHASERRAYARANLTLPLCVRTVAGRPETSLAKLRTQDISSSGIFFLCPRRIEPGTPIEMEVTLVDKPTGPGTVRMRTQACVVRVEHGNSPGWHGLAAAFDDITFIRDEPLPSA
jgi:PilZ domain